MLIYTMNEKYKICFIRKVVLLKIKFIYFINLIVLIKSP